jgi:hypothetical protein
MKQYDPLIAPDAGEWLALDEGERIALVRAHHRRARVRLPNLEVHTMAHAVVETQIAMGDETPVRRIASRLMAEGLDRHDAIHAIASVFFGVIYDVMKSADTGVGVEERYYAELEELSAESWRRSG